MLSVLPISDNQQSLIIKSSPLNNDYISGIDLPVRIFIIIFLLSVLPLKTSGKQPVIFVDGNAGAVSIAEKVSYIEDPDWVLTLDELKDSDKWKNLLPRDKTDFSFTTSSFWLKIILKTDHNEVVTRFLETGRPITNTAILYQPDTLGNYRPLMSGDGIPAYQRQVFHRKTIFRIQIYPGRENVYFIKTGSDGEALNLPVIIHEPDAFRIQDFREQYIFGIYYGILLFVIVIYFFFYARLGEKSFLFYIIYVGFVFLLQFSLDGYSSLLLFPENVYLGNRSVLFAALLSVYFLIRYVRSFLKTKEFLPTTDRVLKLSGWLTLLLLPAVFSKGFLYEISFPAVNILSLISMVIIIVTIFQIKKYKFYPYFTIAILFLIAGSVIFILNNVGALPNSFFSEFGIKAGTGLEVIFLSFSMANRFRELQKEKEKAQASALEKLKEMNRLKDSINIELEKQVEQRTKEIQSQKKLIEVKNKDITDSIRYAQRIQDAILPDPVNTLDLIEENFILFIPKDIVSGDFYWFTQKDKKVLIAAADCTGHGVPGAFMSMIGNSFLNQIVIENDITEPAQILEELRSRVISAISKNEEKATRDGMDIAFVQIDYADYSLKFSGAHNPVYIIKNGELIEIKGTKCPVGIFHGTSLPSFVQHEVKLTKGDAVYLFSDGYADQFGGEKEKKFKYNQLKELLKTIHTEPMSKQKEILESVFRSWKGDLEQVDDILIIGIKA